MATPEPAREPTLGDVLRALETLRYEYESLRRVVIDEFAAARHLIQALDRDVQGITRRLMEQGDDS